jgi:hypothetical protein
LTEEQKGEGRKRKKEYDEEGIGEGRTRMKKE